ncbi:MAG TPA: FecR family protein [Tangfeifania sp.]|nr:FecR family protein [Tangfeifania sp.]
MNKNRNNQSISEKADQLLNSYQVHAKKDKEEVLGTILNKIEQKENTPVRKINWYQVAGISAAASVAVLVVFWFFTASVTVNSEMGETLTYRMPDNSRVVLHDNSSVKFGKYINKRKVALTGKAYFEVVKGDGFVVKTKNGNVAVLGTRFLVADNNEALNVKCYEGKIKTEFNRHSWILEPGTQFYGNSNSAEKNEIAEKTEYPDFAEFFGSFSNAPLLNVIQEIEGFFDVNIELKTGETEKFSGTIETGNLESALLIVCESLGLRYKFEDDYRIEIF